MVPALAPFPQAAFYPLPPLLCFPQERLLERRRAGHAGVLLGLLAPALLGLPPDFAVVLPDLRAETRTLVEIK